MGLNEQIPHLLSSLFFLFTLLERLLLLVKMRILEAFVALIHLLGLTCAPAGFPHSGNGLWYSKPGTLWSRELLPVGNGYQAGKGSSATLGMH
jgi:alpha-L-fucosidase 2